MLASSRALPRPVVIVVADIVVEEEAVFKGWRRGKNVWERCSEVSIEELDLPDGILWRLSNHGILTIGQLLLMTQEDLSRVAMGGMHHFGASTIEKIQRALEAKGLPRLPKYVPLNKIRGEDRR